MAQTLFRGPVLVGKKNEAGVTGYNITPKESNYNVVITSDSGQTFTFVNTAADGANTFTISPNASDGILYAGSLTDDKDLINTKATSRVGDFVKIASMNSTAHWTVVEAQGTWAKES